MGGSCSRLGAPRPFISRRSEVGERGFGDSHPLALRGAVIDVGE